MPPRLLASWQVRCLLSPRTALTLCSLIPAACPAPFTRYGCSARSRRGHQRARRGCLQPAPPALASLARQTHLRGQAAGRGGRYCPVHCSPHPPCCCGAGHGALLGARLRAAPPAAAAARPGGRSWRHRQNPTAAQRGKPGRRPGTLSWLGRCTVAAAAAAAAPASCNPLSTHVGHNVGVPAQRVAQAEQVGCGRRQEESRSGQMRLVALAAARHTCTAAPRAQRRTLGQNEEVAGVAQLVRVQLGAVDLQRQNAGQQGKARIKCALANTCRHRALPHTHSPARTHSQRLQGQGQAGGAARCHTCTARTSSGRLAAAHRPSSPRPFSYRWVRTCHGHGELVGVGHEVGGGEAAVLDCCVREGGPSLDVPQRRQLGCRLEGRAGRQGVL